MIIMEAVSEQSYSCIFWLGITETFFFLNLICVSVDMKKLWSMIW